jgi:hypothetical protein
MKAYSESNCRTRRSSEISRLNTYSALNECGTVKHLWDADYVVASTCAFKEQEEGYSLSRLGRGAENEPTWATRATSAGGTVGDVHETRARWLAETEDVDGNELSGPPGPF